MRIVFLATRLAGTDGVSLEAAKMRAVLEAHGHEVHYVAGELEPGEGRGHRIPEMHFADPVAQALGQRAFSGSGHDPELDRAIRERAAVILERLRRVVAEVDPALFVVQNAWAIPMHLPLALALAWLVQETGLPVLAHNHDYWWERERFRTSRVAWLLERYFPYHHPGVVHLSINTAAQRELKRRRGLDSWLLPNVMDYRTPPPGLDEYNQDFRAAIGVEEDQPLFLQPTRVIPRKGIELAVDLAAALADLEPVLVVTHAAGDEGLAYLQRLEAYARDRGVDLRYVADRVSDERRVEGGRKVYALWDAYPHADFVTYPSLYEGFGNALLETIWFKKPALVNRYPVYAEDIAPKGFRFVEIEGTVTPEAVQAVRGLLADPEAVSEMVEHNYRLAETHYGYATLERVLRAALAEAGLSL
ncbi:glycosyltransferase family 4 protein [Marinithermus hydrothermalis]|uniref:Glycosyl transferase group 1 n=1 Tax=Marinithermus hydrothermalis (strain DSM 14884 / JCM 11576 / T1) TaxID=869210 RepID=F2NL31_MARHT|nr:glycosyltransferase family 4 protein [Marinithermus hydrothermalis]AEB11434.1 glycosyl transferase group 1 [Marinithermus hydrothermalis DSM 14884]